MGFNSGFKGLRQEGTTIRCGIHELIISIWNKEELPEEWKESIILLIYKKGNKQNVVIIEAYYFCQLHTKFIQHHAVKVNSICRGNNWGSSIWILTQQITTEHIFCICQILEKKWEYSEAVYQLFIEIKKAYDSVKREVLYNILIEFGITIKLVRLITMCLTETYSRVRVGKNLSDMFPMMNGLKQGDVLSLLLFDFALE